MFPYPTGTGILIGDTCTVFCDGGYQAILNDTPTSTCACDSSDNPVNWKGEVPKFLCSLPRGLTFPSVSASPTMKRVFFFRCSVGHTGVSHKNIPEFTGDNDGSVLAPWGVRRSRWNFTTVRTMAERVLPCDDYLVHKTVTCQELRCKRQRPALDGKWVKLGNHGYSRVELNPRAGGW